MEDLLKEIEDNTEWLQTTEGDEVECISIENLNACSSASRLPGSPFTIF